MTELGESKPNVIVIGAGIVGLSTALSLQMRGQRTLVIDREGPAAGASRGVRYAGEVKTFDGEDYILERGIFADLSIVKAWKADDTGNLVFRKTARNFNPPAAMCGKVGVVEVEEIVPRGSLDPDHIHLPGIYVHRIVQGEHEKRIEQRTTRKREEA